MLRHIYIRHLSFRKLSQGTNFPWGRFNVVWHVNDKDEFLHFSRALACDLELTRAIPAIDPNTFDFSLYRPECYDTVTMYRPNCKKYASYIAKFDVFHYTEYAAMTPPTLAVFEELKILQDGGNLQYRMRDDSVFFLHLDTIRNYWD